MPPIDDFFEYFKETNSSSSIETLNLDQAGFSPDDADEILNIPISEKEISDAISSLKNGKPAGLDCILNEYIVNTEQLLMPLYFKLSNIIFETGILPESWLVGKNKTDI